MTETILYEVSEGVARITLNRPEFRNAQNVRLLQALDAAMGRAAADDTVKVIVLCGAGDHFSAGHDIGSPGRDIPEPFDRIASQWWDHSDKTPAESIFIREREAYIGLCRRLRDLPKPTIAEVQGACVAGGLMLAWCCDLIVASDDAFFADPVLRMGIPGVEWFAHAHQLNPRLAKEFLFTGARLSAERAERAGMINRCVSRDQLSVEVNALAKRIARQPRMALAMTKMIINQAEDRMGLRDTIEHAFGLHQYAHGLAEAERSDYLGGETIGSIKKSMKDD
jgi:enoyl-CoA hydratase